MVSDALRHLCAWLTLRNRRFGAEFEGPSGRIDAWVRLDDRQTQSIGNLDTARVCSSNWS
jgi:hypothetical protein